MMIIIRLQNYAFFPTNVQRMYLKYAKSDSPGHGTASYQPIASQICPKETSFISTRLSASNR